MRLTGYWDIKLLWGNSDVSYHRPNEGVSMTDESDKIWADKIARDVLERRKKKELEHRVYLGKEDQKRKEAPELWEELKKALRSKCEALNFSLGEKAVEYSEKDKETAII